MVYCLPKILSVIIEAQKETLLSRFNWPPLYPSFRTGSDFNIFRSGNNPENNTCPNFRTGSDFNIFRSGNI